MALIRRDDGADPTDVAGTKQGAGDFGIRWPAIADFLLLAVWPEDGSRRQPGNVMLFVQDGRVKARLVDNDRREVAFVSSDSLAGLLDAVEAMLSSGGGDWRPDRGRPQGKK